jgi:epsilon-lactone hydrolase
MALFFSRIPTGSTSDPTSEPVFKELERRKTVVYVHPNPSPDAMAHALGLPDNLLDFPTDTNRAVAQMHYTNRFARTPSVKYIFSHAGGSISYLAARFAIIDEMGFVAGGEQRGTAADMFRHVYWDTALAASDPVLRMLRDVAGMDQVLFGTDFPYLLRDLAVIAKQRVLSNSELDHLEKRAVLGGNAAPLFPRLDSALFDRKSKEAGLWATMPASRNACARGHRAPIDARLGVLIDTFTKVDGLWLFAERQCHSWEEKIMSKAEPANQGSTTDRTSADYVAIHPLDPQDAAITAAMRAMVSSRKGARPGIEARGQYDALMESVSPRGDVTFEADTLGGVSGLWVRPANWRPGEAIIHLHGGWFTLGSAKAYRHLVGHIAARARARAFIPDYRRAPEYPFPAATDDVLACYQGLAERHVNRIALTGDSAGGNLALVLASRVTGEAPSPRTPVGVAVLSPVTDLTLSGATYETRADADFFFTRPQVAELVHSYLGSADARYPLASPLHGRHSGMPSTRIHVGDDEVLLDDSLRYVERAVAAGVDARADVWLGMPHGFPGSIGRLKAAAQALDAIGTFLADRLQTPARP